MQCTRLLITQMANHVIGARVITGDNVGENVLIPMMFVSSPERKFPFPMRQKQFSLGIAFVMTINKKKKNIEEIRFVFTKTGFHT